MAAQSNGELSAASRAAVTVLVFALACAPFARAVTHPFLAWDDDLNLTQNPWIQGLSARNVAWMWSEFHVGHFMPLTWMSCALEFELWGLDPARFHAVNIALHGVTALFLFAATRELLGRVLSGASARAIELASATGALFFAVHPLRVESVAWATERRDVLAGAFLAFSAFTWLRAQRADARRGVWLVLSIAAFACSLLSKVQGLALPLALLALDAWPLRRARELGWRAVVLEKLPYLALALGGAALGWFGQARSTQALVGIESHSLLERVAQSAYALVFYWRKTFWPSELTAFYERPVEIAASDARFAFPLLLVVAVSGALLALRRRNPLWRTMWTTWFVFAVLVAPVIGLVTAGEQLAADRYTYFAAFAFAPAFAGLIARFGKPALFAACAALIALGIVSWRQTGYWRDTRVLFERALAVEPANHTAHHKLGVLAHQAGDFRRAIEHYDACLAQERPRANANVRYDRALTELALNDSDGALASVELALTDEPTHLGVLMLFAELSLARNDAKSALTRFRTAIELAPGDAALLREYAGALLARKLYVDALDAAERSLARVPDDVATLNRAGLSALYLQRFDVAERYLARAAELDPLNPHVLFNLGLAHEKQGRSKAAYEAWRRVLELDPTHAGALAKLRQAPVD